MPPRTVKKTQPGPGIKRRTLKKTPPKLPVITEDESVKIDEIPVEVKEEVKVEDVVVVEPKVETKKEDEVKDSVAEYERSERLDLEDNDPDYEPEEYGGTDYDEKDVEQEDGHGELDEVEEEVEEDLPREEDGDMDEEEMEDAHEDLEGEEFEGHAGEEHAEMVDADEEKHHEVFKERRKRKEFEVFVGGLDKDATEDDLKKVFSKIGKVTEVRLMMNPQTKKNKGFAFLRFATVEQAKRACTELKNPVVNGKQCGVAPSQDSDTLFLGNICRTWTKEALKEKLKQYGIENIEDLTLVEDSTNEGMNRGFAFLEFSSRTDAMDAFKCLQKRDAVFGVDRPAKVSFADSFIDPGDEIMAQVKTVFVDGLTASWDEDRVREILKKYGKIEKIELARNMPSAKRKDFGFVTFDTHDAAVTCAKNINNEELGEGNNKAKVRARLSRPVQGGKGKHVAHGDLRPRRGAAQVMGSWSRPVPRNFPVRGARGFRGRMPPAVDHGLKRPVGFRGRMPPAQTIMDVPPRARPLAPSRSYDRRPSVPSYLKSSLKRDYGRHEELLARSRAAEDYGSSVASERRTSYRDDYSSRGSGYPDFCKGMSDPAASRAYVDDGYEQRFERPPPSYREGRDRDYEPISGSKRSYTAMDNIPPRYAEAGVRHSRTHVDYDVGGSASQYGDAYSYRLGRSSLGYGGSRNSISGQDSHGLYNSRQGMSYGGGSYGGSDVGGTFASSIGGDYMSRGADVGGSSYSSLYSGRGLGGRSSGSGSYY